MDKFAGSRRTTWQSKTPLLPILLLTFLVVVVICFVVSIFVSGVILGDGTAARRSVLWIKAASNLLVPALVVGCFAGWMLNQFFLEPSRREGALMWTGLLILAGAIAAAPATFVKGFIADRAGYAIRLEQVVAESREAALRSEAEFGRGLDQIASRRAFEPANLAAPDGLAEAGKALADHRALIATARRDYPASRAAGRKVLEKGVSNADSRRAVLDGYDAASRSRAPLAEAVLTAHKRIVDIHQQQIDALAAERAAWSAERGQILIRSRRLIDRLVSLDRQMDEARDAAATARNNLYILDTQTNAGIERAAEAALSVL